MELGKNLNSSLFSAEESLREDTYMIVWKKIYYAAPDIWVVWWGAMNIRLKVWIVRILRGNIRIPMTRTLQEDVLRLWN
jgi:hypothetical protein